MRVVLITQVSSAAGGFTQALRALGHEPVAVLCSREHAGRYGNQFEQLVVGAPEGLDVLVPASRQRIAPLLRAAGADLALCVGFPWKIPPDALAAPRLGIVNFHTSPLPRYRGPNPVAWTIRNGEAAIGLTFHRMDAELDTGAILAQGSIPLEDEHSWDELEPKLVRAIGEMLPKALERVEIGDPGDPQREEEASYLSFFEPEYAWIDWSRPAAEIRRQVQAWRFSPRGPGDFGALAELDGARVRVLRTRLEPGEGRAVECGAGSIWIVESEEVAAE